MSRPSKHVRWRQQIANNTVVIDGETYLTENGIRALQEIAFEGLEKKKRGMKKNRNIVIQDFEEFEERTKDMINSMLAIADVMHEATKASHSELVSQVNAEFHAPKKSK